MSFVRRWLAKYRAGGLTAVGQALQRRYQQRQRQVSPVLWSWFGPLSRLVAAQWPPASPPILILSLPRSGSSWVGETLGYAQNALYLREPVTQTYLAHGGTRTTIEIEAEPPAVYQRAAERAFLGWPLFPPRIVHFPDQWSLSERRHKRLVIKEVNPWTTAWYIEQFQPRIIFLLRHPAAIGLSYRKRGWWGDEPDVWQRIGASYGAALTAAWRSLSRYGPHKLVFYEDLCAEPIAVFRRLCQFADLTWDARLEDFVRRKSSGQVEGSKTSRDSRQMIDAWRGAITAAELADLRRGYCAFELPWYQASAEWELADADR